MSTGPGGLAQAQPQHDAQGEGQGNRAHDQSAIQEQVQGKTQPKSKRWNLWMVAIGLIFSLICTSLVCVTSCPPPPPNNYQLHDTEEIPRLGEG